MTKPLFATTVCCIDGRIQIPVIEFIRSKSGVDYVDNITEPGVVKLLANNENTLVLDVITQRVGFSIEKHLSGYIYIVAHHDCAGNKVNDSVQMKQVSKAVRLLRKWFPRSHASGLWVDRNMKVQEVRP